MAIFCLLCGKRFQAQPALQQHMEVHAGVRSYICSECNRTFPSHTALKRHLRSHTGQWGPGGGGFAVRLLHICGSIVLPLWFLFCFAITISQTIPTGHPCNQ